MPDFLLLNGLVFWVRVNRISLPKWSRSRWETLHEIAHRINDSPTARREAHGARFVGILIGLATRWLGYHVGALINLAKEIDVMYYAPSVGSTTKGVLQL